MDRLKLINLLSASFARDNIKTPTIIVYVKMLADVPDELLEYSVNECIQTCKFFPTIAEIREKANNYANNNSKSPIKEWSDVEKEIRNALKHNGQYTPPTWSTPLVESLMKNRWQSFLEMLTSDEGVMFAQTRMAYEGMVRRKKYETQSQQTVNSLSSENKKKLEENKRKVQKLIEGVS